jgi:hypothetical protein
MTCTRWIFGDAMLVKIAERNNLTLAQLHSSDQFDEIVERTSQELSFKGLKEFVLQQGDITITHAKVKLFRSAILTNIASIITGFGLMPNSCIFSFCKAMSIC